MLKILANVGNQDAPRIHNWMGLPDYFSQDTDITFGFGSFFNMNTQYTVLEKFEEMLGYAPSIFEIANVTHEPRNDFDRPHDGVFLVVRCQSKEDALILKLFIPE